MTLPCYSPSPLPPSYSYHPKCDEQRIHFTAPSGARPPPTGTVTKSCGSVKVIFEDQENHAERPSYGRHGVVSGKIVLAKPAAASKVRVKMEGRITTTSGPGGSHCKTKILFVESHTLWSADEPPEPSSSTGTSCPSHIPFSMIIPATFTYNDQETPLPPSYKAGFFGTSDLSVDIQYTVNISIVKKRQTLGVTKTKSIIVPLLYTPRLIPSRPILPDPVFLSTVKSLPDEWVQTCSEMQYRTGAGVNEPVHCSIFIPSGRIFGISDIVPFHVQLTGPLSSLRHVVPLNTSTNESRFSQSTPTLTEQLSELNKPKCGVSVYLLRQVSIDTKSQKDWRNITIGEGRITPVSPSRRTSKSSTCCDGDGRPSEHEGSLDWEGEVQCNKEIRVGSFNAAGVSVKDFIVLSVVPLNPKSPLLNYKISVPIRLTTDSWEDTTGPDHLPQTSFHSH